MSYVSEVMTQVLEQVDGRYLFGARRTLRFLATAFLCRGHVLIEGPPGTGKTRMAKSMADLLGKSFRRIQFTSDLLPSDILGAHIYTAKTEEFKFIRGPIFADMVLADEINRAPPRTQSALLEAMEERQVTSEGVRLELSGDFFVVATQNPLELEGTFPLPEAQLDRFMVRIKVTHADAATELNILKASLGGTLDAPAGALTAVTVDRARVDAELRAVRCDDSLVQHVTKLLAATRKHSLLTAGASVRGGLALVAASRSLAAMDNRAFVTPDDLKALAPLVLAHRVRLSPEAQVGGHTEEAVIEEIVGASGFPA